MGKTQLCPYPEDAAQEDIFACKHCDLVTALHPVFPPLSLFYQHSHCHVPALQQDKIYGGFVFVLIFPTLKQRQNHSF